MRNLIGLNLAVAASLCGGSVWSQEATAVPTGEAAATTDLATGGDIVTSAEWAAVQTQVPREVIVDALEGAGASAETVAAATADLGSGTFDLYARPVAPGLASFVVVPQGEVGLPKEFLVPNTGAVPAGFTAEDIRQEIVAGMQASIDALCGMRARPTEITARASAFSILEIEATWQAAEVCPAPATP